MRISKADRKYAATLRGYLDTGDARDRETFERACAALVRASGVAKVTAILATAGIDWSAL